MLEGLPVRVSLPVTASITVPYPIVANFASRPVATTQGARPRVLMLPGMPNWAHDTAAQAISRCLSDEFEFRIEYLCHRPNISEWQFDLLFVFFWGEIYHRKYVRDPLRIIKQISSHRWASDDKYGRLTAAQVSDKYLVDAGTVTVPSRRLQAMFGPHREVFLAQKGFEPTEFEANARRTGRLRIGWAGNENDRCKGVKDILRPAAGSDYELFVASGNLDRRQMIAFYNSIDVICVASTAEGDPLPLIEGMACGCFPVVVDVGIVPDLVRHGANGLIVDRDPAAFRRAFEWCENNVDYVRQAGLWNAGEVLRTRTWDEVSVQWREVFRHAYRRLSGQAW